MALGDKYFRKLAKKLGSEWEHLATQLNFTPAEIQHKKGGNASIADHVFKMLVTWRQKQGNVGAAAVDTLIEGLKSVDRTDLAEELGVKRALDDDKYFRKLANSVGSEWEQLATQLDFTKPETDEIKYYIARSMTESSFSMLVAWRQKQGNVGAAAVNTLIEGLKSVGRTDLAEELGVENALDELFREVAADLAGSGAVELDNLATQLNFTRSEKDANECISDQIFNMLVTWREKQDHLGADAAKSLIEGLKNVDRADFAEKLQKYKKD